MRAVSRLCLFCAALLVMPAAPVQAQTGQVSAKVAERQAQCEKDGLPARLARHWTRH